MAVSRRANVGAWVLPRYPTAFPTMNLRLPACPLFVLIVEDHPDTADSLALLVRYYGHEALVAHNGQEAIAALAVATPDAVLMDIGLPGGDGYAVAGRLLAVLDHKPLLVALTGYGHLAARSKEAGFHYHFEKPVDPQQLADLLGAYARKLAGPPCAGGGGK